MEDIFANLRFLSSVLELRHPSSFAQVDNMWYSDKVYLVQRDLVYSSFEPEEAELDAPCRIAASIYVDSYLRDLGFHSRVIAVMVTRLKNLLERKGLVWQHDGGEQKWMTSFWILVIGGIAAMNKPEQQWFLMHLRSCCEAMGLHDRVDAEQLLRMILWSRDWSGYLEKMWEEVVG
jgi:hypothetical protein